MNYTEKYHLPQWEETDRILRTDFNQMCADIENSFDRIETNSYVYGAYTGAPTERDVELGFKPKVVLIFRNQQSYDTKGVSLLVAASPMVTAGGRVKITDTGFHLAAYDENDPYPCVNRPGPAYCYLAFR